MSINDRSLKDLIRFPIDIRRARRAIELAQSRANNDNLRERPIVLDLTSKDFCFDCGRHLAAFAQQSVAIGSPFFFRCSPSVLAVIARKPHGLEALSVAGAHCLTPDQPLPSGALHLTDHQSDEASAIWLRVGCDPEPDLPIMPYPMHPATIDQLPSQNLQTLRSQTRRVRVFFAGNQKPKYSEGKIGRQFGIADRIEVLQTVRTRFAFADRSSICLQDSRDESIAAQDWLPTIASADFFLCPPGSSQPTCHHLVEAMAVGTIPILEYADRISPGLVDSETAITFQGTKGLVSAIERVIAMPDDQIAGMRARVAAFFDQHLCQAKFLRRLRDKEIVNPRNRISLPFHNENFYDCEPAISQGLAKSA